MCAVLVLAAAPRAAADAKRVDGDAIVQQLKEGHSFVGEGVLIDGPLDLSVGDKDVIGRVFKCRGCTFAGPVSAPDVTFDRTVDLSGSTFEDTVDFTGATFNAPVLFGAKGDRAVEFDERVVFSLAVFNEYTSFSQAEFIEEAVFRTARFADTTFAAVDFDKPATFEGASFRGAAIFNGADFTDPVTFDDADFRRRTDFSTATFEEGGAFTSAQFGNGASFLAAEFDAPATRDGEAARFDGAGSAGDLDFTFASFESGSKSRNLLVLNDVVCGGSLVFRDATFEKGNPIAMNRLKVADLVFDVDVVPQINDEDDRQEALRTIESSAKERGDIGEANDAHYALNIRRSASYGPVGKALDLLFYRWAAGYLVRPFQPLFVLVVLAAVVAVFRYLRRRREEGTVDRHSHGRVRSLGGRVGGWCAGLVTTFLDTIARAGPRGGSAEKTDDDATALFRRVEVIVYRLLLVCALIGLANSNPTLRQMVDTLL